MRFHAVRRAEKKIKTVTYWQWSVVDIYSWRALCSCIEDNRSAGPADSFGRGRWPSQSPADSDTVTSYHASSSIVLPS